MNGSDSDDDHCSEPMSTGKSHDRRAAPLEPQETIGRRASGTCSAAFAANLLSLVRFVFTGRAVSCEQQRPWCRVCPNRVELQR